MNRICILIPAYNEAKLIASTLKSVSALLPLKDVYVADDGSNDSTYKIARSLTPNVLRLPNRGKATALNTAILKFRLTKKYDLIFMLDADTQANPDFLKFALPHFQNDPGQKIVCVIGRVKGLGNNWISKYRQWEYLVSHFIHKRAQANLNSIVVVPGCATIYRSYIFNKLKFPTGTLTEDMDFTFELHRRGLSKMVFEDRAIVYVQDPQNLSDFVIQISRWYKGFWQVVKKHQIPWQGQLLDLEVVMLGLEGLYNGLIVILFMVSLIPLTISQRLDIFRLPVLVDLLVFFFPTLIWSSISEKDFKYLLYIPHFYFLRFLSSLIFIRSFFLGFSNSKKEYVWDSNRY
jgi:cellulose synthase/poly-beta-1,6-N-acetylglucosamine synthase-like glycosyltransferase